ncbi:hypothetical protein EAQG_00085 [Escherichia coli TA464]|nr:hypothetical protein EAQG_00085 [Escherichia coli TA464]
MSEKPFTGEPHIKLFSGVRLKIPAPPAQLTFSIMDNCHERCKSKAVVEI